MHCYFFFASLLCILTRKIVVLLQFSSIHLSGPAKGLGFRMPIKNLREIAQRPQLTAEMSGHSRPWSELRFRAGLWQGELLRVEVTRTNLNSRASQPQPESTRVYMPVTITVTYVDQGILRSPTVAPPGPGSV